MIKFKFTGERFAEACSVLEYIAVQNKNKKVAQAIVHRFVLDENGQYIVKPEYDEDGDLKSLQNENLALSKLMVVTPKRLERLIEQAMEAAQAIVNPPSGGDSNGLTSTATNKPPPG